MISECVADVSWRRHDRWCVFPIRRGEESATQHSQKSARLKPQHEKDIFILPASIFFQRNAVSPKQLS
jgi:hypothetical protein